MRDRCYATVPSDQGDCCCGLTAWHKGEHECDVCGFTWEPSEEARDGE